MENSNECKKNFVAIYDGSSAIEDLKVTHHLHDPLHPPSFWHDSFLHIFNSKFFNPLLTSSICPTDPDLKKTTHAQVSKKKVCGFFQAKFCSTVANDIMLDTSFGVVRMWADETSRLSRFRMLFSIFYDREFIIHLFFTSFFQTFMFFIQLSAE